MMEKIRPIKTEEDYHLALEKLELVFHAKPNTPQGDELEVLSMLIHEYEQKHYKIEGLSALEALRYEMAEQGINQANLAKKFGASKSTISEILSGKKEMNVRFLKFLYKDLGIPAQTLLS